MKRQLKAHQGELAERLHTARGKLGEHEGWELVLGIQRTALAADLSQYVSAHRQRIVAALESLWVKYQTSLHEIERSRNQTAQILRSHLSELDYVS